MTPLTEIDVNDVTARSREAHYSFSASTKTSWRRALQDGYRTDHHKISRADHCACFSLQMLEHDHPRRLDGPPLLSCGDHDLSRFRACRTRLLCGFGNT